MTAQHYKLAAASSPAWNNVQILEKAFCGEESICLLTDKGVYKANIFALSESGEIDGRLSGKESRFLVLGGGEQTRHS